MLHQENCNFVNCNLFTHGALRSSWELVETCPCVPDRIGIWKCWFLRRGENRSTWRKTSRSKGQNQQQTQPTYRVNARIRTRATFVGGECSHHCVTLAPLRRVGNEPFLVFLYSFLVLLLPCSPSFDLLPIDNDQNIMSTNRLIYSWTPELKLWRETKISSS